MGWDICLDLSGMSVGAVEASSYGDGVEYAQYMAHYADTAARASTHKVLQRRRNRHATRLRRVLSPVSPNVQSPRHKDQQSEVKSPPIPPSQPKPTVTVNTQVPQTPTPSITIKQPQPLATIKPSQPTVKPSQPQPTTTPVVPKFPQPAANAPVPSQPQPQRPVSFNAPTSTAFNVAQPTQPTQPQTQTQPQGLFPGNFPSSTTFGSTPGSFGSFGNIVPQPSTDMKASTPFSSIGGFGNFPSVTPSPNLSENKERTQGVKSSLPNQSNQENFSPRDVQSEEKLKEDPSTKTFHQAPPNNSAVPVLPTERKFQDQSRTPPHYSTWQRSSDQVSKYWKIYDGQQIEGKKCLLWLCTGSRKIVSERIGRWSNMISGTVQVNSLLDGENGLKILFKDWKPTSDEELEKSMLQVHWVTLILVILLCVSIISPLFQKKMEASKGVGVLSDSDQMRKLAECFERMQKHSSAEVRHLLQFLLCSLFLRYPLFNVRASSFDGVDQRVDQYFNETTRMFSFLLLRRQLMQDYAWKWISCLLNTQSWNRDILWCVHMFSENTLEDFNKVYGRVQTKKIVRVILKKVATLLNSSLDAESSAACTNIKRILEEKYR
jgi:hypothetical protein